MRNMGGGGYICSATPEARIPLQIPTMGLLRSPLAIVLHPGDWAALLGTAQVPVGQHSSLYYRTTG